MTCRVFRGRSRLAFVAGLLLLAAVPATGFETFCQWSGPALPVPFRIDASELSDLPIETAEAAVVAGFTTWTQPTCTGWRIRYEGPIVEEIGGPSNVVRFLEDEWPAEFGNPDVVIAITRPSFTTSSGSCALQNVDVAMNSFGWTFFDGDPTGLEGNLADLQEIATHEAGHFLGLSHSSFADSTMFATYGTQPLLALRDLAQDDIDGVCQLYPRTTTTCSVDLDCAGGELCIDGQCEPICTSDADCGPGLACDSGACVPASDCEVCRSCDSDVDCGTGSCVLVDLDTSRKACVVFGCVNDDECPGDSACFATGDGQGACVNPDPLTSGLCPLDYVCADSGGDLDGDGVGDGVDLCPLTPPGELVDPGDGCSLAEICPCGGIDGLGWVGHGDYVACVADAASRFRSLGLISGRERGALVSLAARSACGSVP